ncbi:MAG: hypothetical protein ACK56I_21230, partial [bacterium]
AEDGLPAVEPGLPVCIGRGDRLGDESAGEPPAHTQPAGCGGDAGQPEGGAAGKPRGDRGGGLLGERDEGSADVNGKLGSGLLERRSAVDAALGDCGGHDDHAAGGGGHWHGGGRRCRRIGGNRWRDKGIGRGAGDRQGGEGQCGEGVASL